MPAITFDTLAYSRKLEKSGFSREQAEAIANANAEALQEMVATRDLVTKKDLAIALSETRRDILKWVIGTMIAQTALVITAFGVGLALLR